MLRQGRPLDRVQGGHQGGGPYRVRGGCGWLAPTPATYPIRVAPLAPTWIDLDGPASFVVLLYEGARTASAVRSFVVLLSKGSPKITLAECPTRAAPHEAGGPHRERVAVVASGWPARPPCYRLPPRSAGASGARIAWQPLQGRPELPGPGWVVCQICPSFALTYQGCPRQDSPCQVTPLAPRQRCRALPKFSIIVAPAKAAYIKRKRKKKSKRKRKRRRKRKRKREKEREEREEREREREREREKDGPCS